MNKDEILKKARTENAGIDEVRRAAEADAARLAYAVGGCICMLLNCMDSFLFDTGIVSSVCWIIYGSMISTSLWVQGAMLKNKLYLIGAVATTLFVILLTVFLFLGMY